jgi:hypothetical protein
MLEYATKLELYLHMIAKMRPTILVGHISGYCYPAVVGCSISFEPRQDVHSSEPSVNLGH